MCLVLLVALIATRGVHDVLAFGPWVVFAAYVMWMLFWAPAVVIDDRAVRLRNVARTRVVPWSEILAVETKHNLALVTPSGRYSAWAAPAPSAISAIRGRDQPIEHLPGSTYGQGGSIGIGDLPRSDSGVAAYYVRRGLERRNDGQLPAGDGLVTTIWHQATLVVLAVLLCVGVIATALAH
jgi:hypothetical protein